MLSFFIFADSAKHWELWVHTQQHEAEVLSAASDPLAVQRHCPQPDGGLDRRKKWRHILLLGPGECSDPIFMNFRAGWSLPDFSASFEFVQNSEDIWECLWVTELLWEGSNFSTDSLSPNKNAPCFVNNLTS